MQERVKYTKKLLTVALLLFSWGIVWAQKGTISGKVLDKNGTPVAYALVAISSLNLITSASENGDYVLERVAAGTHQISATALGYQKAVSSIHVSSNGSLRYNFQLEEKDKNLSEVTIVDARKTDVEKVREQSFTVSSIDVKPLQNQNLDVNQVLNRSTGIRIRESGGLGSDFNFSLNGFSGNQVRFFIDGIPSNFMGAAMQMNNIPVNIIDRIEVYKGVVPVTLGADALGGAVNIITKNNVKDFIDISYSVGSFNTHRAAITSRTTFKKHYVLNTNGFFNYSDNNYTIDAPVRDKVTNVLHPDQPVKLFNEQYLSYSAMMEAGVINMKWADRLLVGLIASGYKKHYQRGQSMTSGNPAGKVFGTDLTFIPTLKYSKKDLFVKNLSLSVSAIYSYVKDAVFDTSSRAYDWDETYTVRSSDQTRGEIAYYKTNFFFTDHSTLNTASLEYKLGAHHTFTLNNTYSYFWRKGEDPIGATYSASIGFNDPNTLSKNITGISYNFSWWGNRWQTMVFGKGFWLDARVYDEDNTSNSTHITRNTSYKFGYGIASSLFITKHLQIKSSFEQTNRLPEAYELFGNGLLLWPNAKLKPESSKNFNFSLLYGQHFENGHFVAIEGGFIFRNTKDLIRLVRQGVYGFYENLSSAQVLGGDVAVKYGYKHWISVELNTTYQDMRNMNNNSTTYKDRLPYIPYLFGNANVSFASPELSKHAFVIGANWNTMYVEEFYLQWPSLGNTSQKPVVPRQLSHTASISLSMQQGRYNIAFTCSNLTNAKLYDNFKIQKPGRAFSVKFRIYLDQFKRK